MPRVSPEHLEQRRQQILDAARLCFARKGFYETSMQDVFRESGLSAGAVYRYFKSKDDLVQAIATDVLDHLSGIFEEILSEDPIPPIDEVIGRFVQTATTLCGPEGPARIAPQAWAAALNDPELAVHVRVLLSQLRGWWVKLAELERAAGQLPPDADPEAVGVVLFGLMPGFLIQRLLLEDVEPEGFQRGVRDLLGATTRTST